MNEIYLHFIWKTKRLPFHLIKTFDGDEITVLEVGMYNLASGPDFFNGKIMWNGIVFSGNIELHVKSSDWYLHKHHHDPAYDNVILHVVYEHNKEVFINERKVPVIELKSFIDWEHFRTIQSNGDSSKNIPCASFLNVVPEPIFWSQLSVCLYERLQRKGNLFSEFVHKENTQILLLYFARAFGMKVNADFFEALAQLIPKKIIHDSTALSKRSVVFGLSGIDELFENQSELKQEWLFQSKKHELNKIPSFVWKQKGCRPANFPEKRLVHFADWIVHFPWNTDFWNWSAEEIMLFLKNMYHQKIVKEQHFKNRMTFEVFDALIINAIVPFFIHLAKKSAEFIYEEKAFELLDLMTSEKNPIIKNFNELGMKSKNASDSQAMTELKNEYCFKKKCLSCTVGKHLLQRNA